MFAAIHNGVITIREFEHKDLPSFAAYRALPEVAKYQSWSSYSIERAESLFNSMAEHQFGEQGQWFQLAICLTETDKIIGDLAVHFIDDAQIELGFSLNPAFQGRGYALLALNCVVDYLFSTLSKHRIVATVDCENSASFRLLEKAKFRREAHFVDNIFFKGKWGSEYQYALLKTEWLKMQ
ncbi:GNAT family N-acetyltransferase [Shewanella pneumatophori]|uniref:GNAT family N-acetyltransferase n=1 Tax=Shewanella pneumatophori TaxID=314092 RepID=A0A9X1ZGL4_9GAMM|nr:GNAT family protein [Shewanella pneumatophori]MCL1137398.1 GNAT family N-acetyltransferase [Shewanella pneumatophori]